MNAPEPHIPICVIDAFTDQPFRGNPAAVCLLRQAVPDPWLQSLAAEMNLSETAFVTPTPTPGTFHLRWFTPATEVDLCGHATLASAHALWERGLVPPHLDIQFLTRSGPLHCSRDGGRVRMDFPARPALPAETPPGLEAALGCTARWVGRSADDYLVEVNHASLVRALAPDFHRLASVPARGVIVTARADEADHDFISRFFAPASGVPEDPVTGSAHCTLAPFWAERLHRRHLRGWQASARGGSVEARLEGDRVRLLGAAVTIWRGELVAPPPTGIQTPIP